MLKIYSTCNNINSLMDEHNYWKADPGCQKGG